VPIQNNSGRNYSIIKNERIEMQTITVNKLAELLVITAINENLHRGEFHIKKYFIEDKLGVSGFTLI